jgi:hypothetical protein
VLPWFGWLWRPISPLCASTTSRQIERPRPTPEVLEPGTRKNLSKTRA